MALRCSHIGLLMAVLVSSEPACVDGAFDGAGDDADGRADFVTCGGYVDCTTDAATGIEVCADGPEGRQRRNRLSSVDCPTPGPPPEPDNVVSGCETHAGCGAGSFCVVRFFSDASGGNHTECVATCTTDADCATGTACLCGDSGANECVPAACRSSEDCGGEPCGITVADCSSQRSLVCRHPTDNCITEDEFSCE